MGRRVQRGKGYWAKANKICYQNPSRLLSCYPAPNGTSSHIPKKRRAAVTPKRVTPKSATHWTAPRSATPKKRGPITRSRGKIAKALKQAVAAAASPFNTHPGALTPPQTPKSPYTKRSPKKKARVKGIRFA